MCRVKKYFLLPATQCPLGRSALAFGNPKCFALFVEVAVAHFRIDCAKNGRTEGLSVVGRSRDAKMDKWGTVLQQAPVHVYWEVGPSWFVLG